MARSTRKKAKGSGKTHQKAKAPKKAPVAKTKALVKRKRKPGPSSTGKVRNVVTDQVTWRRHMQQSRVKFDDAQKQVYLETLKDTGLKGLAAQSAGVCRLTVLNHIENDPDFADMVAEAIDRHTSNVALHVQRRGMEGWEEPVFAKGVRALDYLRDSRGWYIFRNEVGDLSVVQSVLTAENGLDGKIWTPVTVPATVRKFSDALLILEAKRTNPEYRDKSQLDLTGSGGVMWASPLMSEEEQEVEGAKRNEAARQARLESEAAKANQ